MNSAHEFLKTLTIVLGTAAITTVVFQRLRQPVVLGYLVAGMIVGPHVPIPLHADEATTHMLSELGVILLMFSLGLEFSLRKLFLVGPKASLIALVQCSLMVWLGYVVGQAFGWTPIESFYTGGILAISSTTIIVKAFDELKVQGKFKETVFGVLIVEDLVAIILMTVLTTVSSGAELSAGSLLATAGRLAAFLASLLVVGFLTVPRFIRFTVRLNRPETTAVAAVGVCFASALLAASFGYSVALGAFLAGSLIAESGEEKRVEHVIQPLRDVFGAIFFVSVGMLIDPRLIAENWAAVAVLTAAVVGGKLVFVAVSSFLTGAGIRPSVQTGMSLAQIGEFSFIIAGLGASLGATRNFLYPVAVAVSALTTLFTPWLIRASDPVAAWIDRKLPRPVQVFASLYASWIERLGAAPAAATSSARLRRLVGLLLLDGAVLVGLVVGASTAAASIAEALADRLRFSPRLAWALVLIAGAAVMLPFVLGLLRVARQLGFLLATRAMSGREGDDLESTAAPRRVFVVALQLVVVSMIFAPLLALTQPFFPAAYGAPVFGLVIVILGVRFWRTAAYLHGHVRAVSQVVVDMIAKQALKPDPGPQPSGAEALREHLHGLGQPRLVRLEATSHAAGKSLAQLDLRGLTGASVLALTRDGQVIMPGAAERLAAGDVLAVAGTREAIASAMELLESGRIVAREETGTLPPGSCRDIRA